MKTAFFITALFPVVYAGAAATKSTSSKSNAITVPNTCLVKTKELYGDKLTGTSFDDSELLKPKEDSDSYYRLTSLKICAGESGNLVGLQAGVTKYSATTNLAI